MRKLNNIINEMTAKRVAKKLAKEQNKKMINDFESYILSQMLLTGKDRKTIIKEVLDKVQ